MYCFLPMYKDESWKDQFLHGDGGEPGKANIYADDGQAYGGEAYGDEKAYGGGEANAEVCGDEQAYGGGEADAEVYGDEQAYGGGEADAQAYGDEQAYGGGEADGAEVYDEQAYGGGEADGVGSANGGGCGSDAVVLGASLAKLIVCLHAAWQMFVHSLRSFSVHVSSKEDEAPDGFNEDEQEVIERSLSAAVPGHHCVMEGGVVQSVYVIFIAQGDFAWHDGEEWHTSDPEPIEDYNLSIVVVCCARLQEPGDL